LSYCRIILHSLGKSTVITALNASAHIDWVFEWVVQFKNKKSTIGVATTPADYESGDDHATKLARAPTFHSDLGELFAAQPGHARTSTGEVA
jgi:hypothetical protein